MLTKCTNIAAASAFILAASLTMSSAQAAKSVPGPVMSGKPNGKAMAGCTNDWLSCINNVEGLCKRLVRGGFGGGSIRNCTVRKERRCNSRLTRCHGKIDAGK